MKFPCGRHLAWTVVTATGFVSAIAHPRISGQAGEPRSNETSRLSKSHSSRSSGTSTTHSVDLTVSAETSTITGASTVNGSSTSLCSPGGPGGTRTGTCRVSVGTVNLHYWPTGTATRNRKYPTTVYLPEYDFTMTSPLIYYVINTMYAQDDCGQAYGTTLKNVITSYHLSDVSTLQPFANSHTKERIGPALQLHLSDLKEDCPQTYSFNGTYREMNHNVVGQYDPGCNPLLEWPVGLKYAAGQDWKLCGRFYGGYLGIFDPPIPVKACSAGDIECLYEGASVTATSTVTAAPVITEPAERDKSTTVAAASPLPTISTGPSVTESAVRATQSTQSAAVAASTSEIPPETSTTVVSEPDSAATTESQLKESDTVTTTHADAVQPVTTGLASVDVGIDTPTSGADISESRISAGTSSPEAISVENTPTSPKSTTKKTPVLGVVGTQTISGVVGSSVAIIGSQTLTLGGARATLEGDQVASLGSSGVVVQASGGVATTIATTQPEPTVAVAASRITTMILATYPASSVIATLDGIITTKVFPESTATSLSTYTLPAKSEIETTILVTYPASSVIATIDGIITTKIFPESTATSLSTFTLPAKNEVEMTILVTYPASSVIATVDGIISTKVFPESIATSLSIYTLPTKSEVEATILVTYPVSSVVATVDGIITTKVFPESTVTSTNTATLAEGDSPTDTSSTEASSTSMGTLINNIIEASGVERVNVHGVCVTAACIVLFSSLLL